VQSLNSSFKEERPSSSPSLCSNKKRLLISDVAQHKQRFAGLYSRSGVQVANNYHFKLFSHQAFFYLRLMCLEGATL
jgi:hypothetical protein